MKYVIIFFICFSLSLMILSPQDLNYNNLDNIYFSNITKEHGLSQASILCICQDHKGFMWFGTEEGLNRYDGKNFVIYKYDFEDKNSISNSYVKCIIEDSDKNLWIGTGGGGLNLFDREKEIFISFKHNPDDLNSLSSNNVSSIIEDIDKNLWIGTENGLNRFDGKNFIIYKNNPEDKNSISDDYIDCIIRDNSNNLWIGTGSGGINIFIKENNSFKHIKHNDKDKNSINSDCIVSIFEDSYNNIWIGTDKGLDLFNIENNSFVHFFDNPEDKKSIKGKVIKCIFEDRKKNIWIGTRSGGLNLFNRNDNSFIHFKQNELIKNSINDNNITCINEDLSGILWIGTYTGGVNKIDWIKSQFKKYIYIENNSNSLCDKNVWAVTNDLNGKLWIGTSNGLSVYDKKNKYYKHYKNNVYDKRSLTNNFILSLLMDSKGLLWIGTMDGLNLYDKNSNSFIRFFYNEKDKINLKNIRIYKLFEDSDNNIWIGTHYGLYCYYRNTKKLEKYLHDPDNPFSLSHELAWSIGEDSDGNLWIGTINGLNKFDKNKKKFYRYYNNPDKSDSLSYNLIMCIFKDLKNNLWIGTWGGGLNKYDKKNDSFIHFNEKDGLANNVVYGIMEDKNGRLWMSTNNGISQFNIETGQFTNYYMEDGLICNEFNCRSAHKNIHGEMFFGGISGLISFFPDKLEIYKDEPKIIITDFSVLNKSLKVSDGTYLKKSISETEEIILSYKENIFSFEFASLHFSSPEKNQYAYMLKGFDNDWIYSGNRNYVTYTNLNPGKYKLMIRGSNKDGIWNNTGKSIKITVTPPFWKKWWAYLFYILASIFITLVSIFFIQKRVKENFNNKLKEVEINNLKEINVRMTKFFINFAHEIKTPLTLIRNYLGKYILKTSPSIELDVIKNNFDKITRDVVNYLDSEKLKMGKIFYNHSQIINLSDILIDKIELFKSIAENKKIIIETDIEYDIFIKSDPYAIDRIINNLIDNAIRYTNENGFIKIILQSEKDKIRFITEDNGIGIEEEQKNNLFFPFYQLSHEKRNIQGIGMGLNIVKQILESLEGEIDIESEPGKGSKFYVTLKKHILKPDDVIQSDLNYSKPIDDFSKIEVKKIKPIIGRSNILIVEDNIKLLNFLQENLSLEYNCFAATNGKEALEKLNIISKPDIIISDIMMDVMNGYKFFEAVINDDRYYNIPFIFITVKSSIDEKIKALSKGIIDYIYKPFYIDEIAMKVNAILKNINNQKEKFKKETFSKISNLIYKETNNNEEITKLNNQIFQEYRISIREKEIIEYLVKGLESKEIASELNITENTVNTHIKRIYNKCKINNRVELIKIFMPFSKYI